MGTQDKEISLSVSFGTWSCSAQVVMFHVILPVGFLGLIVLKLKGIYSV